jgi:beta-glucuronidase
MRSVLLAMLVWVPLSGLAQSPADPPFALPTARMQHSDEQDPMGERLFRTTSTRTQISLAGYWQFRTDPKDEGRAHGWHRTVPAPETSLWVPGTWNTHPRYWPYIGAAWFQRTFEIPRSGNLLIRFGGVFYRAEVWLDGHRLGDHEGGYSPFEFVTKAAAGKHLLVVRVDNRLTATTLPKKDVDWFPYGGMHRPAYLELLPDASIERFHVIAGRPQQLKVQANIRNLSAAALTRNVRLYIDSKQVYAADHQIPARGDEIVFDLPFPKPRVWSPEEPNLYSARLVLGDNEDDRFTRFGVRTVEVRGPAILVNGRRLLVRGANRHEDHPEWGPALPGHLMRRDIELLKTLGANVVRSHYPPSEMFMDYCDQAGLLYMNEIPAWQYTAKHLINPEVQTKIRNQFREMVERDLGRPSILSWSLGNEWYGLDQALVPVRELIAYARTVDSTHPITLITVGYAGPVHDSLDIIATNWGLHEWYDDATALDAAQKAESIAKLDRIHVRAPSKPVLLSEFGGAESRAGWHNWGNAKWSEQYQWGSFRGLRPRKRLDVRRLRVAVQRQPHRARTHSDCKAAWLELEGRRRRLPSAQIGVLCTAAPLPAF